VLRRLILLTSLLLLPSLASAQYSRYDGFILGNRGPLGGQSIAVCSQPAITLTQPCSPLISLYQGSSGVSLPNPLTSDSYGNFHFYAPPGIYTIQIYGPQVYTPYVLTDQTLPGGTITNGNPVLVVDGVQYTTLASAFSACPATGCTIDMRGNPSATASVLGTFDPGTTQVTILLGPYTYTVNQIVLRTGMHIVGAGHAFTFIYQVSPSTAPFILPPAGQTYPANVANGVLLYGFNLGGIAANTTDGLSFVATPASGPACNGGSGTCGGGLFYSELEDLAVGVSVPFGRNAIRFDSTTGGTITASTDQFNTMKEVVAFRAANGQPALNVIGPFTGQLSVEASQFDGPQARTDTTAVCNINIGDGGSATYLPYSVVFKNVTSQWAWNAGSAAICLTGLMSFTSQGGHFENDNGIIKETIGGGGHGNWGVNVSDSYIATSSVDSTNGFIASLDANSSLIFSNNSYYGTAPDSVFIGAGASGCLTSDGVCKVLSTGNTNASSGAYEPWNRISETWQCVMAAGACSAINLIHTYNSGAMSCSASWNGTGTFTGILKLPITVSGGTGGVGTVTPASTVGTDTANIFGTCSGIGQ
jgi:hypothetical protein